MISDEAVEKSVDYLRDSSNEAAQARATRLHMEDYSRVLKAEIMAEHLAEPVNAQERWAYSDMRYKNHLELLKKAIYDAERMRFMRGAAEAKLEAWRTFCANQRGLG